MDQICLLLPVRPDQSDTARDFMHQLDRERSEDYDRSERRIGITKEVWFLASGPDQVTLVGYMESADFAAALGQFSASRDEFDMWFKQQLAQVTGIDLNDPPEMALPELLSCYVCAADQPA